MTVKQTNNCLFMNVKQTNFANISVHHAIRTVNRMKLAIWQLVMQHCYHDVEHMQ